MAKRVNRYSALYQERAAKIRAHVTFKIPKYADATPYQKRKVHEIEKLLYGNGEPGILQGGVFASVKLPKKEDQETLRKFSGQPNKKDLKYVYIKTVLDHDDQPVIPKVEFVKDAEGKKVPKIVIGNVSQTSALFDAAALVSDPRKEMQRALDSFGDVPAGTLFYVKNGSYAPGIEPGVRDVVINRTLKLMEKYDSAIGGHHWKQWILGFNVVRGPSQRAREDFLDKQNESNERQKILDLVVKLDKAAKKIRDKQSVAYQNAMAKMMGLMDEAQEMKRPSKKTPKTKPRRKHKN